MCKHDTDLLHQIAKETKTPIIDITMRDNINKVRLIKKDKLAYDYIGTLSKEEAEEVIIPAMLKNQNDRS